MRRLVAWFVDNPVAANSLTAAVLLGGALTLPTIREELFPEITPPMILFSMVYPGASPREVEEGIVVKVEEALHDVEQIKRTVSRAAEGLATIGLELHTGVEPADALDKIKTKVDAIDTFPEGAERPVIREMSLDPHVINVVVSGEAAEGTLKRLAERVYDELQALPEVSQVKLANARPYEISIELSEEAMRRHGLSFEEVVAAVRRSSVELPGGTLKTAAGEILLRAEGKGAVGSDFAALPLRTLEDGSRLTVGDVAHVADGFEDVDVWTRFDGRRAMILQVFRGAERGVLDVADAVTRYVDRARPSMPPGIRLETYWDNARMLRGRLELMLRNAAIGLSLVLAALLLFFRLRLALFVGLGLVVSIFGALWTMPLVGSSVNLVSLFGFIVVLGMLVDDGVVVSENIYRLNEQGAHPLEAARRGVEEVALPVVLAVATTIAAFAPMLAIPGVMGDFAGEIPRVVILCLAFSLVEGLLALPAHLRGLDARAPGLWTRVPDACSRLLDRFAWRIYAPLLVRAIRWRYAAAAGGAAVLLVTAGWVFGGRIRFVFFPSVESDYLVTWLTMPPGTPAAETDRIVRRIEEAAETLRRQVEAGRPGSIVRLVVASTGAMPVRIQQGASTGVQASSLTAPNLGEVVIELRPAEEREGIGSAELERRWRDLIGEVEGATELTVKADLMVGGKAIDLQLAAPDLERLRESAEALKARLRQFPGVYDVADSFVPGKTELQLSVGPAAEAAGISEADLARQVRAAVYGAEAQRIQRGREEVKVMVRYPAERRRSLADLEAMRVRAADGAELPFSAVARLRAERGPALIERADRRRSVAVTASVDLARTTSGDVMEALRAGVLPELEARHPGLTWNLEGRQRQQEETMGGIARGMIFALVAIYILMAIPFRSYLQPFLVMLTIPFGVAGAIWAHVLMGMDLSFMSMVGVMALAGVVVNNAIILIDFVNQARASGLGVGRAIVTCGPLRLRAIFLTTVTTFAGLAPIVFERSMQAQFLIPMAVSLAFGLVFGTAITLVIVPVAYVILEDVRKRESMEVRK